MDYESTLKLKVEIEEAWMNIANPELSVDDAVTKLKSLGNDILEIDYEGRRIKVAQNG